MSGWYLTRVDRNDPDEIGRNRVALAEAQFKKHGFKKFERCRTPHHDFLFAYAQRSNKSLFFRTGEDWIACAGTIAYRSLGGEQAMQAILSEFTFPYKAPDSLIGQYALIVFKQGSLHVLTDYTGAFQLFHDCNYRSITTSLLTLCAEQKRLSFNKQAVYEYVFSAFSLANDTVFEQINRLGPDRQLVIAEETRSIDVDHISLNQVSDLSFDEQVRRHANNLLDVTKKTIDVWGSNVRCPLSGGLDSRLALALFRAHGVNPELYVYGNEASRDVKIARIVAGRLKQDLSVIDKSVYPKLSGEAFAERVNLNFHECDGLVTDGGLFDSGAGSDTRRLRQDGNALFVSGGCGEVFRNFFFLRDKEFSPEEVVHAFYSRYDPEDLTEEFNTNEYDRLISGKIRALLKADEPLLTRQQVEALYPLMRCRAFFGREITIEGRHGDYFLPFLDYGVVTAALTIPLKYKTAGMIEAAILSKIAPDLASMPSAYGHDFSGTVPIKHRFNEYATQIRTPKMRKSSYVLRKRLRLTVASRARVDSNLESMDSVIDTRYPYMSRFFKIDQIEDAIMKSRISAIEYLAQHFSTLIANPY